MKNKIFTPSTIVCIGIMGIMLLSIAPFKSVYKQMAIDNEVARLEAAEAAGELGEMNQTGYVDHILIKDKSDISENAMQELKSSAHYSTVSAFPAGDITYADTLFNYRETSRYRTNELVFVYKVADDIYPEPFYYAVSYEKVKIDSEDDIECNEYVLGWMGEGDIELDEGTTVFSSVEKVRAAM